MIINHNLNALNAWRNMSKSNTNMNKNIEKLSSGLRINRAADDAAGLAISEKMLSQIKGLDMAAKNAQDGISLIQTAEGALTETHAMLHRMRELSIQSANDTNVDADRTALQAEINELAKEISRIATSTEFNTQTLLDGTFTDKTFQIGANDGQTTSFSISNMTADSLGVDSGDLDITTHAGASAAISSIDDAISTVSTQRANLGAIQNRLEHTINNLSVTSENLTAAESRIRDADMASYMMKFTREQILMQSSNAMLAQANQIPQNVLSLLR